MAAELDQGESVKFAASRELLVWSHDSRDWSMH